MTEIQFLAQFILDEKIPVEIRKQFLDRITEIENTKTIQYVPYIYPSVGSTYCLHDYPPIWLGTTPPTCRKCGQPAWTTTPVVTSISGGTIATNLKDDGLAGNITLNNSTAFDPTKTQNVFATGKVSGIVKR